MKNGNVSKPLGKLHHMSVELRESSSIRIFLKLITNVGKKRGGCNFYKNNNVNIGLKKNDEKKMGCYYNCFVL